MKKNIYLFSTVALLFAGTANAQDWRYPLEDPSQSFYSIKADFYQEFGTMEQQIIQARQDNAMIQGKFGNPNITPTPMPNTKGTGYKQFKRWEHFMEPRVFPSGDLTLPSSTFERYMDYLNSNPTAMAQYLATYDGVNPIDLGTNLNNNNGNPTVQSVGNSTPTLMSAPWSLVGPIGAPTGGNAGRINRVVIDPVTTTTVYACAPAGGLWKSTNSGGTWNIIASTDALASIGCSDVAIDPTNNQILYLATGDGDAGDTYSIGVLKSTNGGTTWSATGLAWNTNQGRTISRLLINPTNTQIVIAFTSNGIYRTTNGGTSWTQVQNTNAFKDGEYKPGDPNTVYATGTRLFRSTDGGATWTNITAGLPTSANVDRLSVAVSPADANYVYILAGSAANSGYYGLYRSTDSGLNWTQRSTTPNVMGWSTTGSDTGGQSWYDQALAVSPTNRDIVLVGGVNIWRSTNGGTNWTLHAHWTGGGGAPFVHADMHDITFQPGSASTYYVGCDGGVFKTTNTGGSFTDNSSNMAIAQPYRIGLSNSNATLWITGHQDNGTNIRNGANYFETMGGDGMDCFIDRTNNNVMYGEQYNGAFNRTTNGGGSWTGITGGLTGAAAWVTPWVQDPATANTLWAGYTNVFRSTNQGTSWTQMGSLGGSGTIVDIKVAPSNAAIIYAARSNALFKSTNTGGTWTNITGTLPVGSAAITRILIDPSDANNVWITFSGYAATAKVYVTTNGGTSWTNISTGLPNLPVNCSVYTPGSTNDAIYVGCDVGVYYRDNTNATWTPYNTGLPNVPIFDLDIYAGTSKIRAATYGRSVWEVDINNPGTLPPVAAFTASSTIVCVGQNVNFTDQSSFTPTSWSWTFPSATPGTSTAQNPTNVVWNTPGTYTVTLNATNANGSNSTTVVVTVTGVQAPPIAEGFQPTTFLPAGWVARDANNDGVFWARTTAAGGFGTSTASALFDNYNNDVTGLHDEMWSPKLNFSGYTGVQMTFDVAYARYDATYNDTLQVLVSTDCGITFTQVFLKGGTTLATAPDNTNPFVPTATQWRTETVNLNTYNNNPNLMVVFRNRGRYGNMLYIDNINISGTLAAPPTAAFTASATTVCAGTPVNFTDASTGGPTGWSWTFPSGSPGTSTTQNPSGIVWNTAGTYTVTLSASNANGSTNSTQVITVNPRPTVTASSGSPSICTGSNTTLTGGGASTYAWMPGSLSGSPVTVSPTSTTTYTVTGTGSNGCTNTQTVTVTVNNLPIITATAGSATICSGSSTTLTGGGGTTYSWMPGSLSGTTVTVSPTSTTTYTVTGTNANGCQNTQTVQVTVNTLPTITATAGSGTICSGNSTTLTGGGGVSYTWMPGSLSGSPVTVSPTSTTTYTVTGTGSNGCTRTQTVTVTVNTSPTVTASAGSATICNGSSTTLTGGGANTYTWMPGSLSGSPVTVSPASTTTYTVTGTAVNGCSRTQTVTVTVNNLPTITASAGSASICTGSSTTLTGGGGTTYSWMPGSLSGTTVTVSPASTTTYTVTGTGSNGCQNTQTVQVTVNTLPTITASAGTSTICNGSSTTLTGGGGTTYSWMPGSLSGTTVTVSPTSTTTYTVTGTNGSGCQNTQTVSVTVNSLPNITATPASGTICAGNSTTLTGGGGTAYSWMPGSLSGSPVTVSPSSTTTYTVTGTGSNGCQNTQTVTVNVTALPNVGASAGSTTLCTGNSTTLTGSGASTYTWMPGSLSGSSVNVSPSSTTTYTVTGTQSGCQNTSTITITVTSQPNVTATAGNPSICTGSGTTLTGGGATTYTWMPGSLSGTSVNVSPASTTTYTVTGVATGGCSNTQTVTVTVNALPNISASAGTGAVCAGSSVALTGSGGATYNWMPGSLSGSPVTVTPSSTTTYTVTGTDANGCSNNSTVSVTVNSLPTVTFTPLVIDTICLSDAAFALTGGSPAGGTYSGNGVNSGNFDPAIAGLGTHTLTYTYTDGNGCSDIAVQDAYVDICTGIAPVITDGLSLAVMPNPNNGSFQLSFGNSLRNNCRIEIMSTLGQTLYLEDLNSFTGTAVRTIDLSTHGAGMYLVRLSNGESEVITRVITR